jgi:hypothetical protein
MVTRHGKGFWAAVVVVLVVVALLPALAAYRYTAPSQRNQFLTHPWRGWSFLVAALAVPGDSHLKTAGAALRKADWLYRGSGVDPQRVELLFVAKGTSHVFRRQLAAGRSQISVVPTYRFVWVVVGAVDTKPPVHNVIVAVMDYRTGGLLYDVRKDLAVVRLLPESTPSPSP